LSDDSSVWEAGELTGGDVQSAEWDALAQRSGNVFATREWLSTWLVHEPLTRGALTVITRRPDGELAGLLPLKVHRHRPTVLRPIGPWPPPEGPLICAPEDESWVVRDVAGQLATRDRWDVIEMDAVPARQPWLHELQGWTLDRVPSTVIDLAGVTWEQLAAGATRNARRDMRRRGRRLHERYTVTYRRSHADSLHTDVDTFLRLHWARWGDADNVLTPSRSAFLHDFAKQALSRGWLALWVMELDGQAVAADLNFRYAGREVAFMSGRDPTFHAEYVGLALMYHTIEQAAAESIVEFHLLRGDQPFKSRLPHREFPVDHMALAGSLAGTVAIAGRATSRTLNHALQRRRRAFQRRKWS
jgi:CelD/BcsL family acetyltransferase involved in cellulose biosynthesis